MLYDLHTSYSDPAFGKAKFRVLTGLSLSECLDVLNSLTWWPDQVWTLVPRRAS
jgi:hypothetical protein